MAITNKPETIITEYVKATQHGDIVKLRVGKVAKLSIAIMIVVEPQNFAI